MSEVYFNIDLLGKLYIEEIFVYYGEPLMFSCKNAFDNLFLVNCIETNEMYYKWLALPISKEKLSKAKYKMIEARDIFLHPEDNILWTFDEYFGEEVIYANKITTQELDDRYLPIVGVYLTCHTNKASFSNESINRIEVAKNENRAVLDFSFEYNNNHGNEMPADLLSKSIYEIQRLVFSIAHVGGSTTSKFPKHVIDENSLVVDSTYAASFGMRFKSDDLADAFGNVKFNETIIKLMKLLSIKNSKVELENLLTSLSPKVGKNYEKLLELFKYTNTGYKAYYAAPNLNYIEVSATPTEVSENLVLLESYNTNLKTQIELSGTLVGIDVARMTFVFIDEIGEKYEGKINNEIDHEKYTVPCRALVTLDEITDKNLVTNNEKIKYVIKSIDEKH